MSEYDDIQQISDLQQEQARINDALAILDEGGTVPAVVISPTMDYPASPGMTIATTNPSPSLVNQVKTGLKQRHNAINQELRQLGISNTPPDHN